MALDERYIVSSDLEGYFVDKDTGLPLANGILYFFQDDARTVPKDVFQLSGAPPNYNYTSMGSVINLSSVGTPQNSGGDNVVIYYFPFDSQDNRQLYYVVCTDSAGTVQFTREGWPNPQGGSISPTDTPNANENQISNPTFNNVYINEGITTVFTVSGATNQVFPFAPSWDFVISGTGTVTIQRFPIAGSDLVPTNPPYVLDVLVSTGITSCYLNQRFNYNSGLWSSYDTTSVFLNGSFVAKNLAVTVASLEMFYVPSSVGIPVSIMNVNVGFLYQLLSGSSSALPIAGDTNSGAAGYVDIQILFPEDSHLVVSAINLFPSFNVPTTIFPSLDSSNRNEAYEGDYYIPRLNARTQNSYLVGWDFPMNPFQFGAAGTITATPAYIADQTISQSFTLGGVTFSKTTTRGCLRITHVSGVDPRSVALIQYLSGDIVREMSNNNFSINLLGFLKGNSTPTTWNTTFRIYLFACPAGDVIPSLPSMFGTLNADGTFGSPLSTGWIEIPRGFGEIGGAYLPTAQFTVSGTNLGTVPFEQGFSGWGFKGDTSSLDIIDKFAIVVTFTTNNLTNASINLSSISCVAGDIPCRPAPLSSEQTLKECEFYYEKSYETDTVAGSASDFGVLVREQAVYPRDQPLVAVDRFLVCAPFDFQFRTYKRTFPTITLYRPTATTPNQVTVRLQNANASSMSSNTVVGTWTPTIGRKSVYYASNSSATLVTLHSTDVGLFGSIRFHYVADARLGIV